MFSLGFSIQIEIFHSELNLCIVSKDGLKMECLQVQILCNIFLEIFHRIYLDHFLGLYFGNINFIETKMFLQKRQEEEEVETIYVLQMWAPFFPRKNLCPS